MKGNTYPMQEIRKPDVTCYKKCASSTTANSGRVLSDSITASITAPITTTAPNETQVFVVTVENTGNTPINGITIKEKLTESHMSYVANSGIFYKNNCTIFAEHQCREGEDAFVLSEDLSAHEKAYLTFMTKTDSINLPEMICNYATVTANDFEAEIATNSLAIKAEYAEITAEKFVTLCADKFIYTIKLKNTGNTNACGITLNDKIEKGNKILSIICNGHTLNENTDYFTCASDYILKIPYELQPDESIEITITETKK